MSTETINQKQLHFGKQVIVKKQRVLISPHVDSGSDTDSVIDSPLANSSICALCNVSKHHLGQGELNRYAPSAGFDPFQSHYNQKTSRRSTRSEAKAASARSTKHYKDCDSKFESHFDTLNHIGRIEIADPTTVFDPTGHVIAHHCCAAWSFGVAARTTSLRRSFSGKADDFILIGVDKAVLKSLNRKCKYCQSYGASVKCRIDHCLSWYHYPCAVASGAFQDTNSCSILCTPEHRHEATLLSANSACSSCDVIGDLSDLLFCITCGYHYHARCINEHLIVTGEVRAGWQCPDCKVCQHCSEASDDKHMIICEICDKTWHTYCILPQMTTIPKDGWSCNSCRTCAECGNKANANSQCNTGDENVLCRDCQRLRNKNKCVICTKDMIDDKDLKCSICLVHVHEECELDKSDSAIMYACPKCRLSVHDELQDKVDLDDVFQVDSINQINLSTKFRRYSENSCNSDFTDEASSIKYDTDNELKDCDPDLEGENTARNIKLDDEKPNFCSEKVNGEITTLLSPATQFSQKSRISGKPKRGNKSSKGGSKISRKGSKIKSKDSLKRNPAKRKLTSEFRKMEACDIGMSSENSAMANHFKTVVYPITDKFLSQSDICAACGSIGDMNSKEAQMVFCMKCAQSYHYYCSGLKNRNKIPHCGWICLHCNNCEVCESTTVSMDKDVITCQDCNKRVHHNCVVANLPKNFRKGSIWKCDQCKICNYCGKRASKDKSEWKNSLLTCSVCWSRQYCMTCDRNFVEDELILKCFACQRWQHASHESIYEEQEMLSIIQQRFKCVSCRPRNTNYRPILKELYANEVVIENKSSSSDVVEVPKTQEKDGVIFTENGISQFNRELGRLVGTKKKIRDKQRFDFAGTDNGLPSSPMQPDLPGQGELENEQGDNKKDKDKRTRKTCRPGIGGFIQRSRNRCVKLNKDEDAKNDRKIKRKKSKISDIYPPYIQDAFFCFPGETPVNTDCVLTIKKEELNIKTEIPDNSVDSFFSDDFISTIKQERKEELIIKQLPKSEPESCLEDDFFLEECCIVELDDDLPERSPSVDGLNGDDLENDLNLFGTPINFEDEDIGDMTDIFNELVDSDSETESEKKDPQSTTPIPPNNPDGAPTTKHAQVFKQPGNDITLSPRHISRSSYSATSGIQGQIIYNPSNQMGHQVLQVQNPSGNSPHISPQIVRLGSPGDGAHINHPFPANFVQMPPRRIATGQNQRVNQIAMVHHSQIQNMHNWNDSRKLEKTNQPCSSENPVVSQSSAAKNMDKWRNDETLGDKATISPVLYANIKHPNLRNEHPDWSQRQKQIQRLWRRISPEDRAPFLTQARENRHKQKALNAKNHSRQRISSSGSLDQKTKKEPLQNQSPSQISQANQPVAKIGQPNIHTGQGCHIIQRSQNNPAILQSGHQPQIIQPPSKIVRSPISGHQIITQSSQSQIIRSGNGNQQALSCHTAAVNPNKQSTPPQTSLSPKNDHWKQYVVPSPECCPVSAMQSPNAARSPAPPSPAFSVQSPVNVSNSTLTSGIGLNGGKVPQSPSNSCPSPSSAPSTPQQVTPLLNQDPFINQSPNQTQHTNADIQQCSGTRNRHVSHDYSHHSPMNILSPHSPMPPSMSPNLVNSSEHFSSPPPNHVARVSAPINHPTNHVVIPSQRFHQQPSGNAQVPLQVHIQQPSPGQQIQPQQFDRLIDNLQTNCSPTPSLQQQIRHPQQASQSAQQVVVNDQLFKNMERKERMRQIEQQRGTQPWQASGQIIMNHPFTAGQNGNVVASTPRFIHNQNYFNQPGIRFIQGTPQQQTQNIRIPKMRTQIQSYPPDQTQINTHFAPQDIQQQQIQQQQIQQQHINRQIQQPLTVFNHECDKNQNTVNRDSISSQLTICSQNSLSKSKTPNIDQYINNPISTTDNENGCPGITTNGKFQIDTVTTHPVEMHMNSNSGQLNTNFSNNSESNTTETEKFVVGEGESQSTALPTSQPVSQQTIVPQLDGFDDSSDDSEWLCNDTIPQYDGNDDDSSSHNAIQQSQNTLPGVILTVPAKSSKLKPQQSPQKTQLVFTIGEKKKDQKDVIRINSGESNRQMPRNISPKPKESSPKQTIVATAKVTKPNSPEAMVNEELAAQSRSDRSSGSEDVNDTIAVPKIPPPPVDPEQFQNLNEPDEILRAKMKIYQKVASQRAKQGSNKTARIANTAKNNQTSSQVRKRVGSDSSIPMATSQSGNTGQSLISLGNNRNHKCLKTPGQQILIKGTDSRKSTQHSTTPGQNKLEILRQIQSVKNPDSSKTLSFGGKTVNVSQIQRPTMVSRAPSAVGKDSPGIPLSIASSTCGHIYKPKTTSEEPISIALQKSNDTIVQSPSPAVGQPAEKKGSRQRSSVNNNSKSRVKNPKTRVNRIASEGSRVGNEPFTPEAKTKNGPGSVKRIYQHQGKVYFKTIPQSNRKEYLTKRNTSESSEGSASEQDNDAQNALIKRLLNAEKVDLASGKQRPDHTHQSQPGPIQQVSIEQLKTLGISLKQSSVDSERNGSLSSVKTDCPPQSASPIIPSVGGNSIPADPVVKQEPDIAGNTGITINPFISKQIVEDGKIQIQEKKSGEIKQEFKNEKARIEKGNRKRKQSIESKTVKKRKLKSDDNGHSLQNLSLSEAPIRLNIDALPPLGGGTVSKLGKDWEGLGKKYWDNEWNFGGWLLNAVDFYDAFSEFNKFHTLANDENVPAIIDFNSDYKSLKNSFEIVVSEDEFNDSSDEEEAEVKVENVELVADNDKSLLPPPTAVDFPVAPSSPEISENDLTFIFLDQVSTTNDNFHRAGSPEFEISESCSSSGKDPVTVTLTFRSGNDQNIEHALKAISNIIGDSIIDFSMVPDGRKKDLTKVGNENGNKDENKRESQVTYCKKCSQPIFAHLCAGFTHRTNNGEYCTRSCLKIDTAVREDMSKYTKTTNTTQVCEKKLKNVMYRRKLFKISMADLIEHETIIDDGKNIKSPLKPLHAMWRGHRRKLLAEKANSEIPHNETDVKKYWNYWTPSFGNLKTVAGNGELLPKYEPCKAFLTDNTDTRRCHICDIVGDKTEAGRLLFYTTNKWLHVNCIQWNSIVVELRTGGLVNVPILLKKSLSSKCSFCNRYGASVNCMKFRCDVTFHFLCGLQSNASFHSNRCVYCPNHSTKTDTLTAIVNHRKLFIQSDEISQIISAIDNGELNTNEQLCLRYGNIFLKSIGKIVPEIMLELEKQRLPVGIKFIKRFWSHDNIQGRLDYTMSIECSDKTYIYNLKSSGFALQNTKIKEELGRIFCKINELRSQKKLNLITVGDDLFFGFNVPQINTLLSSLPWMEFLEPKQHNSTLRSHFSSCGKSVMEKESKNTKRFCANFDPSPAETIAKYNIMMSNTKPNISLKKMETVGIGLFARKPFEVHEMITQYNGVINSNNKTNNKKPTVICIGNNLYIDGSLSVCSCRYLNHSLSPNCIFEKVILPNDKLPRIVLRSTKNVEQGEELTINFSESLHVS